MKKKVETHYCDRCGEPAILGMYVEDRKKLVNVCERCMYALGSAKTEEEKSKILDEIIGE